MLITKSSNGRSESKGCITIVNISAGNMDADTLGMACRGLNDIPLNVTVVSANSESLDDDEASFVELLKIARNADIVLLKIHSDPSYFKKYDRFREVTDRGKVPVFLDCNSPEIMKENRSLFSFSDEDYRLVRAFVELGGDENNRSLLLWMCKSIGGLDQIEVPSPIKPRAQGLYHPDHPREMEEKDYLDALNEGRPTIGILFHQTFWNKMNIDNIDALIRAIEGRGANTIPVFCITSPSEITGSIGIIETINTYFMKGGQPRIQSLVVAMGFSQITLSNPSDSTVFQEVYNFFADLDVPVLQATTVVKSRDSWKKDTVGMGPIEISTSVIWPEFDGQIITVPGSFLERDKDGNYRNTFVQDRVDRIASLAIAWAVLRRTPVAERKVVFMLNMYPPCNDRLGGAGGLDTYESMKNLIARMKERGYTIDHVPGTGKEILDELMAGLTNDLDWVPLDEIPERAADLIGVERYMEWFNSIPARPREAVCRNWGQPPGEITTFEGKLIVPGVRNGNLFIGIQPNRGHHAHAEQLYHSTDVVMPHQYLAYYRWLRDVFNAHVLVHMGTHGTLEWLPGKGNGLSEDCYPDVVLDTIPNVYPYIIDDPGEGVEAKRRTNSVLIGYMVPSMTRAEGYDDLLELDVELQSYLNSESMSQDDKSDYTAGKIFDLVTRLSMKKELGLEENATIDEIMGKAELLYDYVSELKDAIIKDGLHVLGSPPEGDRMIEMMYSLTRLRNGSVPSLRQSVAASMGCSLDDLLNKPSDRDERSGLLNGSIIDDIDGRTQALLTTFFEQGFAKDKCMTSAKEMLGDDWEHSATTVSYICDTLYPNVCSIADEMRFLDHGMGGGYVPPGPSGSPTRGNAHLLPTGRNYYSIDPDAIPGEASWKVGRTMAETMVKQYVEEKGCYPENIGIIVWATDTMKTGGDDIAYILYLMGLRPRWGSVGGKVVGLEVIPIGDLGRPRIDVTLRISGMFRDSFPNLVNLIDEGVEMIASLDESEEVNYMRKHLKNDILTYIRSGLSEDDAKMRSMVRVFGDPPGEHGTGVGVLIESSKWGSIDDLAETYKTWGCHAYGRRWKGEKMPEAFVNKMASLDVTVKNHNDREFDLLDIDDDYEVLGGMNAAVRAYGGHKPYSVMGDSSDIDRLKLRTLEGETSYVIRSRVLNPKWLEGLKQHGFSGAIELSKLTEYMLGWSATSDNIEPWMFEAVTERFVFDEKTREWIDENNPYALMEMVKDLIEAVERGLWDAPEETFEKLKELYLETEGQMEDLSSKDDR